MILQRTLLTTVAASVLLGSVGWVGFATLNPAQADTLVAQQSGPGRGNPQGQGQGNCPGRGQRGARLAEAATQLGVTEAALKAALGIPAERPQRPDLAAAATQLGTTEAELRESLHNTIREQRQGQGQGRGMRGGPPDFTALAQQYGVSEAEFRQIMGIPDRPDLATAAAQLGVTEAALREALRSVHGGRGPGGPDGPDEMM
jgi:hypothetical protein